MEIIREEWPEKDEFVVCTVKELKTFGVFVGLEEYGGKEGLIHISAVSSGWVKHLRDYVREGQKIVCKVLHVDAQRGHIDLSLKAVKESQKKERIKEWKREKKVKNLLSLALSSSTAVKIGSEELDEVERKLVDTYGSLYDAFVEVVKVGKEALTPLGINPESVDAIHEVAVTNVKIPSVQISGYVELTCPLSDGVEIIKKALKKAEKVAGTNTNTNGVKVECSYIAAPRYKIRVTAPDYKKAENVLSDAANAAIEEVKSKEGTGKFYRKSS
ncbi:MAG: translation initiation factor IF-2 subunit alpha [Methanophagales archaeon]|nr:translation initiation factor IF-2 subunit alpha [Methanophagales archaeon]